ncbi:hypothetical protein ACQRBK_03600 [Peptoniphilaceae bacterium SGI.137]|nr:hypothetical protein [Peptoniphilaceae bacterium]MDY3987559.1 hypothetical protein [Peptoniphilaceae bacterium]MDY5841903.1 hypothetical protein [Peptoniphilaceae bacterium]MDY6145963.1 hypothetical protein [Peptoniphilaceae bacterium]
MITLVLGPSGSGKTTYMIDKANAMMKSGNGNIAFIDSDDSQMFSLDHKVRLINVKSFGIQSVDRLYGFLAGIIACDYDVQTIYVDGIYDIMDVGKDLEALIENLGRLTEENHVSVVIGLNLTRGEVPQGENVQLVELSVD